MRHPTGEKIRIGLGLGTRTPTNEPARFRAFVRSAETHGFDSLWFSERVTAQAPDPVVAMAVAAGLTERMKFGMSVMVLPGRNPVLLAKSLASLDRLSGGRLLPAFGLGVADPREQQAFGVARKERGPWFEEALPLLKRLWSGEPVDHDGERFHYEQVQVLPTPLQDPLEVWLGGIAPSELKRVGRHGEGWLPSFCTPADVKDGWATITDVAAEHDRALDPGHLGALVVYADGPLPDDIANAVQRRRPDLTVGEVIPASRQALADRIVEFVEAGASKFVVVPFTEPDDWDAELAALAEAVLPLQT